MQKRFLLTALLLCCALALAACAPVQNGLAGDYEAVDPPVESGEMVIERLSFEGDKVTMISGDVRQTVGYRVEGDTFTLRTDYGDFAYAFSQQEDGALVIDGVTYRKR